MKYPILALLVILCSTKTSFSQSCDFRCWNTVHLQGGFLDCESEQVAFEDDFNGTLLDTTLWQTYFFEKGYEYDRIHGECEEQFFFEDNVSVSNGSCILTGLYEPNSQYTNSKGKSFTRDFTSGMIMTRYDKPAFSYGRYEARMKIPGSGWWPAFWLWHHDEVDIMENMWDDTKFFANVYSTGTECGDLMTEHNANLLDGNWHTFAVEWTPFKIMFYHNGNLLSPTIYRLYDQNGNPLDIDCDNNVIPGGDYYLNPNFLEIRERAFRPIIGLGVLPKNHNDCNCPYSIHCWDPWGTLAQGCGNMGNPMNANCDTIGEVPAIMKIDYVKIYQTNYTTCNSVLVYGDNCSTTGNPRVQLECTSLCPENNNNCCPVGSTFDGTNCDFNMHFSGVQINVKNNSFYITPNFHLYPDNGCPSGTIPTSIGCLVALSFPSSFHAFVSNNSLYTTPNCVSHLYIEDYSSHDWLNEVEITNISGSSNISIIAYDNYEITYKFLQEGDGSITIYYKDDCGNNSQYTVNLSTDKSYDPMQDLTVTNIEECENRLSATVPWLNSCNTSQVEFSAIVTDKFDNTHTAAVQYDDGTISVTWDNIYLVTSLNISCSNKSPCYGQINGDIDIDIPPCDECCQEGFAHDGANCFSGYYLNGVTGYISNNKFYTTQNCDLYPTNNCCPPGTINDGSGGCYYKDIHPGFNGFVLDNSFYTDVNCEKNCCPEVFPYDGANCHSGVHFDGVTAYVSNNKFYTTTNCLLYPNNECCPPGTTKDGTGDCFYSSVPLGYQGFSYENSFYTLPNCEICCPPGSTFDGANCYYGVHFEGVTGFIENNTFYTTTSCTLYPNNDCCPPGSSFDGANCYFGIHFPEEYNGFIYNNSFYTTPVNCYEWSEGGDYKSDIDGNHGKDISPILETRQYTDTVQIYPNPFSEHFIIDLSEVHVDVDQVIILSSLGGVVRTVEGVSAGQINRINAELADGVYFVKIILTNDIRTFKVIKL